MFDEAFAAIGRRSAWLRPHGRASGAARASGRSSAEHPFDALKIPVLHSVGWFDNVAPFSFADYECLMSPARAASTAVPGGRRGRPRDVPPASRAHRGAERPQHQRLGSGPPDTWMSVGPGLDFFDVFLKGKGDAATVPRARWFLGNVGWRTSPAGRPPESRELRLYLGSPRARPPTSVEGGTLLPRPTRRRE